MNQKLKYHTKNDETIKKINFNELLLLDELTEIDDSNDIRQKRFNKLNELKDNQMLVKENNLNKNDKPFQSKNFLNKYNILLKEKILK